MVNIAFEINGRKVKPNNFGSALENALLDEIGDSIKKSLQSVLCPSHHQRPKVLVIGRTLDNLSISLSGCCDELIQKATKKLS